MIKPHDDDLRMKEVGTAPFCGCASHPLLILLDPHSTLLLNSTAAYFTLPYFTEWNRAHCGADAIVNISSSLTARQTSNVSSGEGVKATSLIKLLAIKSETRIENFKFPRIKTLKPDHNCKSITVCFLQHK